MDYAREWEGTLRTRTTTQVPRFLAHLSLWADMWAFNIGRLRHPPSPDAFSSETKDSSQSKPDFIWRLHGSGERKFVWCIRVTWPRWPPCLYMVKTLKVFFSGTKVVCSNNEIKVLQIVDGSITMVIGTSSWYLRQICFAGQTAHTFYSFWW